MDQEKYLGGKKPEVTRDRDFEALLGLLTPATRRGGAAQKINNSGVRAPDRYMMESLAQEKADDITTGRNHAEILTDIQLAREVLVSSIMSPQDMISTDVTFDIKSDDVPSEVLAAARDVLEDYFTKTYNISDYLPDAFDEALFGSGADVRVTLPITALDSIINHGGRVSTESLTETFAENGLPKNVGILGPSDYSKLEDGKLVLSEERKQTALSFGIKMALESLDNNHLSLNWSQKTAFDENCLVCDNFDTLKMQALAEKLSLEAYDRQIDTITNWGARPAPKMGAAMSHGAGSISMEVLSSVAPDEDAQQNMLTKVNERLTNVSNAQGLGFATAVRTADAYDKRPKARPLRMKLPTESLIPVHVPGNPQQHVGYFLIQDIEGNPLWLSRGSQNYRQLANRLRSNNYDVKNLIGENVHRQMFGNIKGDSPQTTQALLDSYGSIIEQELKSRIRNGASRSTIELSMSNEVKRVMLARKLSNCGTVLTFIPKQQITYFAFYYNDSGFGESLLDRTKIMSNVRSVLLFANTMVAVRKAVGNTELKIELDPDDDDPESTVEYLFHEFSRTRNRAFPLAASTANDTVTFLQQAGVSVAVSGNSKYPETRASTEDKSVSNIDVDIELEKDRRDKQWQGFGLSPELIDGLSSPNFAESIVSGNLLMAKRVLWYQKVGTGMGSEHCRQQIRNDGLLYEELVAAIGEALDKLKQEAIDGLYEFFELDKPQGDNKFRNVPLIRVLIDEITERFVIQLPEPDVSKFEQQVKMMETYASSIENGIKYYITPEMMDQLVTSEDGNAVNNFIAMVKGYYMREWMRRNNVLAELDCLLDIKGDAGTNIVESVRSHNEQVQDVLGELVRVFKERGRKFEHDLEADQNNSTQELGADYTNAAEGSGGGGGSSDWGNDAGGGDDWGDTSGGGTDDWESDDALGGGDETDTDPGKDAGF